MKNGNSDIPEHPTDTDNTRFLASDSEFDAENSKPSSAPPSSPPRVSVVIPVYNGEKEIGGCLRSVLDQTYPRQDYEIIVVNNASTDRTAAIVAEFPVRLVDEPKRGVANARNAALAHARGELIVFTDADCVADSKWLEELVRAYDGGSNLGGVGGYLANLDPQTPIQYYIAERSLLAQELAIEDGPYSAPFVVTANALLPRQLILDAGGFDPQCRISGEDADLCWRIGDSGKRFILAPGAVVYHRHRPGVRQFCRWMYRYGIGSVYLMKKHRQRYGIGHVFFDTDHYCIWTGAIARYLRRSPKGEDPWDHLFTGYDVLRFACFTAGRVVGSIRYRAIIL